MRTSGSSDRQKGTVLTMVNWKYDCLSSLYLYYHFIICVRMWEKILYVSEKCRKLKTQKCGLTAIVLYFSYSYLFAIDILLPYIYTFHSSVAQLEIIRLNPISPYHLFNKSHYKSQSTTNRLLRTDKTPWNATNCDSNTLCVLALW